MVSGFFSCPEPETTLITIGVTLFMEGRHKHVPKAYIYLPMGFVLLVEMLQMRYDHNRRRKRLAADA